MAASLPTMPCASLVALRPASNCGVVASLRASHLGAAKAKVQVALGPPRGSPLLWRARAAAQSGVRGRSVVVSAQAAGATPYELLQAAQVTSTSGLTGRDGGTSPGHRGRSEHAWTVVDPRDGSVASALEGLAGERATVVAVVPQLGDFDSAEYGEQLAAVASELADAGVALRVVGIGDADSVTRYSAFTGLDPALVRVDPAGALHRALGLHEGPAWRAPELVPEQSRPEVEAWVNYMAMCAGLGATGTIQEIARGYLGDRSAPERLAADAVVTAGPVKVMGTRSWKIGPLGADLWWADEAGYQRPVELATVRLRVMAEVLGNWGAYVKDPAHLALRGATFVFEGDALVYEWRDRGVLQYSETMPRPLSFLQPYLGERALNALALGDPKSS